MPESYGSPIPDAALEWLDPLFEQGYLMRKEVQPNIVVWSFTDKGEGTLQRLLLALTMAMSDTAGSVEAEQVLDGIQKLLAAMSLYVDRYGQLSVEDEL